jgi:spectinomycin phosphotransferase/16S rRNA (guanine(1405)-N(7))-methyltransferase
VLTPPDGFSEDSLVSALAVHWRLDVAAISYSAVGFGSHHWDVTDAAGARWFVTVDELQKRRQWLAEPLDAALERLRRALGAAVELRARGLDFVVAPVASHAGEPVVMAADEFAVAVYPFMLGKSFDWGEFSGQAHRQAVLELVIAVHQAPPRVRDLACADSYRVQKRDELEAVLDGAHAAGEAGPYTEPMRRLVSQDGAGIRAALRGYDRLVSQASGLPARSVLTHGEPHAGNTMLTDDGYRLIDWDTTLVAPPERDLWMLDPGDGSVLASYQAATGAEPVAGVLDLYRARWDITDVALEVSRFVGPHKGTEEDEKAWQILVDLAGKIGA